MVNGRWSIIIKIVKREFKIVKNYKLLKLSKFIFKNQNLSILPLPKKIVILFKVVQNCQNCQKLSKWSKGLLFLFQNQKWLIQSVINDL